MQYGHCEPAEEAESGRSRPVQANSVEQANRKDASSAGIRSRRDQTHLCGGKFARPRGAGAGRYRRFSLQTLQQHATAHGHRYICSSAHKLKVKVYRGCHFRCGTSCIH